MSGGIRTIESAYSVDETVARLRELMRQGGASLFCEVDHSGEAASAGFLMRSTKLLIFGNPRAGTPVMLAAPSSALDLPLKLLVAETAEGKVEISWNDPVWLRERHGFSEELVERLRAAEAMARAAAA